MADNTASSTPVDALAAMILGILVSAADRLIRRTRESGARLQYDPQGHISPSADLIKEITDDEEKLACYQKMSGDEVEAEFCSAVVAAYDRLQAANLRRQARLQSQAQIRQLLSGASSRIHGHFTLQEAIASYMQSLDHDEPTIDDYRANISKNRDLPTDVTLTGEEKRGQCIKNIQKRIKSNRDRLDISTSKAVILNQEITLLREALETEALRMAATARQ
jgi:hypothetical protein